MKVEVKGTIVTNDDKWIYDWCEIQAVCPKDVAQALEGVTGDVTIEINSGGGNVFAGNEIGYLISQYKGKTTADIVGFCGSAATVIACSANQVRAVPSAMYMIHNVAGGASGDYHDMDKNSEILQKANKAISATYQKKTGKSEKELLALMDRETWMTASEAKEDGFIDSIIGEDGNQPFTINNAFATILSDEAKQKIRNIAKQKESDNASPFLMAQINLLKLKGEH